MATRRGRRARTREDISWGDDNRDLGCGRVRLGDRPPSARERWGLAVGAATFAAGIVSLYVVGLELLVIGLAMAVAAVGVRTVLGPLPE